MFIWSIRMENNDQNPTQPPTQGENTQCDPASNNSCGCSTGGSKGFKTVILIVVLLIGGAVASRSLLQNNPKPSCCPGQSGSPSGQCPKEVARPACDQTKTTTDTETKSQGCPVGEENAGSPCCPGATLPDALPKNCPKQSK